MNKITYNYLALGDSYTIGEKVPLKQNFPNQTIRLLKKKKIRFNDPAIVATTGWTTDELQEALTKVRLAVPFNIVTLLIGVNNQYRGRTVEDYIPQFTQLLEQAIAYAGGNAGHVIVLSIPDWGVTPFAKGRNRSKIAKEINAFNAAKKTIARSYGTHYINITPLTREASKDLTLLAKDGLHPSAKDYCRWAEKVAAKIETILTK
jgi:lysophospholipase L1-like esterase